MTISPDQLLVPIPDTCSKLGNVSRTTVYALVNQGELVKVNIGRRGFITAESLAAYVDRLSEAAASGTSTPSATNTLQCTDDRPTAQEQTTHTRAATACDPDPPSVTA
jgi:hypothetical protein